MPTATPQLDRFIRRLHRRLTVLRLIESAGLASAAGASLGVLMFPILYYRGISAILPLLCLLLASALGGLLWRLSRLPQSTEAATEADRQLHLADLLATALSLHTSTPSSATPFAPAVLAMAEARCASLSPSTVILHRLGRRSWSGIGLAGALMLTLALLAGNPLPTQASASDADSSSPAALAHHNDKSRPGQGSLIAHNRLTSLDHPNGEDKPLDNADTSPNIDKTTSGNQQGSNNSKTSAGAGAGAAKTNVNDKTPNPTLNATRNDQTGADTAASGAGTSRDPKTATNPARAGTSAAAAPTVPPPPWTSPNWPAARESAEQSLRAGRIPASYEALVREYFSTR